MRVFLLGRFEVSVGARTIGEDGWRLRKAASLVKLLWSSLEARAAANNLYQALHVARRTLEPKATEFHYLSMRGEQLVPSSEGSAWVDVSTFERPAREARDSRRTAAYREAIGMYSGDLLPRDRYEEWADRRREELLGTYLSLLL